LDTTVPTATQPIGSIGIRVPCENDKATDFQVQYPELGFMFDESFHGRGYATEAVRALLERFWIEAAAEVADVVEAYVRPDNTGSLRVVAKYGFDYVREDGEDHVYGVTRPTVDGEKGLEVG
jgi:RimJ/RimL family protein N-acetyltransferase